MNVTACIKRENVMLDYPPHLHTEKYQIITNHIGSCVSIIGGNQYKIEKNDIIIVPPGTTHSAFSMKGFADFYVDAKHLHYDMVHVVKDTDKVILPLMEMISTVLLEKDTNYKRIADALLDAICCYIDKYINNNYRYPFVTELKNTIIENFIDPDFKLDAAISQTGYNKDYMRRCFFADTNKTPLQYLIDLRMNRAKMLLLQNDYSRIGVVSERCGFKDSFYFSTVFKKHTGMPPAEYRKLHIEKI